MKKLSEILTQGLGALQDGDPCLCDALAHLYWVDTLTKPEYVGARNYLLAWQGREGGAKEHLLTHPQRRRELYADLAQHLAQQGQ